MFCLDALFPALILVDCNVYKSDISPLAFRTVFLFLGAVIILIAYSEFAAQMNLNAFKY